MKHTSDKFIGFQVVRLAAQADVEVSHLAVDVGLSAAVKFAPDAWEFCSAKASGSGENMRTVAREENARQVLRGLRRGITEHHGEHMFRFFPQGTELQAPMVAMVVWKDGPSHITVMLDGGVQ